MRSLSVETLKICFVLIMFGATAGGARRPIVMDLIQKHGYPVEEHDIMTEDGYLLTMHRIPHGKNNSKLICRPPVLVVHGLIGSAETWVILGPGRSLAFVLADLGYDVWLGNVRGTNHSRRHATLDPDRHPQYWQFSWHEIGVYDLPAKIDYILETTNQKKLFYIGHSQGSGTFFVMASERPKYNAKIRLKIALAPGTYMFGVRNPVIRFFTVLLSNFMEVLNSLGGFEVVQSEYVMLLSGQDACEKVSPNPELCGNMAFLLGGYDSIEVDRDILPTMVNSSLGTFSFKQVNHYLQLVVSGRFRHFDYGQPVNLKLYASASPPDYRLDKVSAPVALFYSKQDWLVSVEAARALREKLPNVVHDGPVRHPVFNHMDFVFAKNARDLLYDKLTVLMSKY